MRFCLIPLHITPGESQKNLMAFLDLLPEIARHQPDLICLPECTFSGYLFSEDELARFAETVPGHLTRQVAKVAKQFQVAVCFGMIEVEQGTFYNTQLLFDRTGTLCAQQRKISEKPPFTAENKIKAFHFGSVDLALVTCGDLFEPELSVKMDLRPNVILTAMSRSFTGRLPDPVRWEQLERQVYLERVKQLGITTLIVNALEAGADGSFGGALVIDHLGHLLAESPHGSDQLLYYDLPDPI